MLPQFDTQFFIAQLFWCLICFFGLWAFLHFLIFPKIKKLQEERKNILNDFLKNASELEKKASDLKEASEAGMHAAQKEAKLLIEQAKVQSQKDYAAFAASLDQQFQEKFAYFQKELEKDNKHLLKEVQKETTEILNVFWARFLKPEEQFIESVKKTDV